MVITCADVVIEVCWGKVCHNSVSHMRVDVASKLVLERDLATIRAMESNMTTCTETHLGKKHWGQTLVKKRWLH